MKDELNDITWKNEKVDKQRDELHLLHNNFLDNKKNI